MGPLVVSGILVCGGRLQKRLADPIDYWIGGIKRVCCDGYWFLAIHFVGISFCVAFTQYNFSLIQFCVWPDQSEFRNTVVYYTFLHSFDFRLHFSDLNENGVGRLSVHGCFQSQNINKAFGTFLNVSFHTNLQALYYTFWFELIKLQHTHHFTDDAIC